MNIEAEIAARRQENLKSLHKHVRAAKTFSDLALDLRIKVKNYLTRFDMPRGDADLERFVALMKYNIHTLTHFVKDPVRQSAHQEIVYTHMEAMLKSPVVCETIDSASGEIKAVETPSIFQVYSPQANSHLFLTPNGIFTKAQLQGTKATKSIDFLFEGRNIYAGTHKYTKDEGGGQDNQFKDAKSFLANAPSSFIQYKEKPCYIMAILDGEYYTSRMKALRAAYPHDWFIIGNHEEVLAQILALETKTDENQIVPALGTFALRDTQATVRYAFKGLVLANNKGESDNNANPEMVSEEMVEKPEFSPIDETFKY